MRIMMNKGFLFTAILLLALTGCTSYRHFTVASMRGVICDGESGCLLPCCILKEHGESEWFTDFVHGFTPEEGYEYEIETDDDYNLVHIDKKVKKTSSGVSEWQIYDPAWGYNTPCEERYKKITGKYPWETDSIQ